MLFLKKKWAMQKRCRKTAGVYASARTLTLTHTHTPVMPNAQVSENDWKMIHIALNGSLILSAPLPNSRGPRPTLLYTAATPTPASAL
jgi:hypothetical protein